MSTLPERLRAEARECLALVSEIHYHTSSGPLFEEAALEIETLSSKLCSYQNALERIAWHELTFKEAAQIARQTLESTK